MGFLLGVETSSLGLTWWSLSANGSVKGVIRCSKVGIGLVGNPCHPPFGCVSGSSFPSFHFLDFGSVGNICWGASLHPRVACSSLA